MSRIIFLRHAEKKYKNSRNPKGLPAHDPPLKEGQEKKIIDKAKLIFQDHGMPTKVYCSPFLRTRQTLDIIKPLLGDQIPIEYSKEIEEFLGLQRPFYLPADIDKVTAQYTKPTLGKESFFNLSLRAEKFYQKIKEEEGIILVIGHGIFITQIYKSIDSDLDHYIKQLSGTVIENNLVKFI